MHVKKRTERGRQHENNIISSMSLCPFSSSVKMASEERSVSYFKLFFTRNKSKVSCPIIYTDTVHGSWIHKKNYCIISI